MVAIIYAWVYLVWLEKEPIHVGQFDFVVVEEDEFPDAAASQHLGRDAAHAPDAYHRHATSEVERSSWVSLGVKLSH